MSESTALKTLVTVEPRPSSGPPLAQVQKRGEAGNALVRNMDPFKGGEKERR